jgi:hypothetical protein
MSKDKSTGKKLADMMYGNPEGAAFGIYPKAGKRSEDKQDREAAKNFPVDLARGVVAGAVGMPGDIESLIRMLPGLNETTVLPTSEDVLKRIPFGSDSPTGRFASGLGTLIGGSAPVGPAVQGVKAGARGALSAARAGERMAERVVPQIMERGGVGADVLSGLAQGSRSNVMKPKGGNWITGSVEGALKPLRRQTAGRDDPAEMLGRVREIYTPEEIEKLQGAAKRHVLQTIAELEKDVALNNWVDRNLGNYIKKEMATPEDPVRRLAEEGIIHIPTEQVGVNRYQAPKKRQSVGGQQLGKSEAAKAWEDAADVSINAPMAGNLRMTGSLNDNPWLAKLSPEERVYALNKPVSTQQEISGLGFDHILDVLSEDLASGRIRPEQLNKVSMEQAVRRTYEYDQEMAKKMREAQIKATEGMPTYKEYPEGYKWVELTAPKENAKRLSEIDTLLNANSQGGEYGVDWLRGANGEKEYFVTRGSGRNTVYMEKFPTEEQAIARGKELSGQQIDVDALMAERESLTKEAREKVLENALKYEGETMGHCVGGYCPDVMEGRSRIYSLRDAKGEPHVTIETSPFGRGTLSGEDLDSIEPGLFQKFLDQRYTEGGTDNMHQWLKTTRPELAAQERIVQIKGKQNRAPKEDYLPYVQDFVKSGQWSDVGDLRNAGLRDIEQDLSLKKYLEGKGAEFQRFIPEEEYKGYQGDFLIDRLYPKDDARYPPLEDGMARGGPVHFSDNPDVMRLELAAGGAVRMQAGGIPKRVIDAGAKAIKALKPEKEAAVPLTLPRVRPTTKDIMEAAERVGKQQAGEFVRSPLLKDTTNLAGRSKREFDRLKKLDYKVTPIKDLPEMKPYEAKIGEVNIALPGDQTISDMLVESVDDMPIGVISEGGANFGRGRLSDPEETRAFWASNIGPAGSFQRKVTELARLYDTDMVTAYHLAMGQTSNNFAQHLAEANMKAIDYSKLDKSKMNRFDSEIAAGTFKTDKKTGERIYTTFPEWPGIANPEEALEAMKKDPELRKWFNDRMKTLKSTKPSDLPNAKSIEYAMTEPDIRDLEINMTGLSAGRMKPGAELIPDSAHQTYSHDIPGTALGRAPELSPFSISFPDATAFVRENYRAPDFTGTIQKVFPHQVVDEAYLEDMYKYYTQLRKVRGFNEGGAVRKAEGGEITADDLILEERKL